MYRTPLLVLLLLVGSADAAQIYKWTDEQGVHYGPAPPPGVNAGIFTPERPPPGAGKPDPGLQEEVEAFEQRRTEQDERKAAAAREKEIQDQRRRNCDIARENLQLLTSRGRSRIREGDTYRVMAEEERQERISTSKSQVEEFCD